MSAGPSPIAGRECLPRGLELLLERAAPHAEARHAGELRRDLCGRQLAARRVVLVPGLLAEGGSRGEFRRVDAERYATRLRALLDGFSVHVAVGLPGTTRDQVLDQVGEFIDESRCTVIALTSPDS